MQFDLKHMCMISDMVKELVVLVSEGRFEARRPVRVDKAKAPRPAAAAAGKRAREPNAGELALVGAEFVEGFISWKVVGVGWSETVEEVVVWYYDVEMAAELDITEEDCELACKNGIGLAPLEYSSIKEMRVASAHPN